MENIPANAWNPKSPPNLSQPHTTSPTSWISRPRKWMDQWWSDQWVITHLLILNGVFLLVFFPHPTDPNITFDLIPADSSKHPNFQPTSEVLRATRVWWWLLPPIVLIFWIKPWCVLAVSIVRSRWRRSHLGVATHGVHQFPTESYIGKIGLP